MMRIMRALAPVALAVLAAGCTVQPAFPVAAVRIPPPVVVETAPVLVAPSYRPHPGRGWKHGHKHF